MRAERIVLAVGGRPYVPDDIPGALEHAITSDDVFRLENVCCCKLCVHIHMRACAFFC